MNSTINPKIKSILWRFSPMLLAAAALLWGTSASAQVASVDELSGTENDLMSQVTDIDQLSDVKPTDWAFQALQSLVERYGCIAGYPDGTYRGNRALTRYEFAAGLNACLDKVLEGIGPDGIDPEELATIRRLQEEFKGELATLRGRVDALEARTAELEANQFSTTTKLKGEVIFGLTNVVGDDRALTSAQWDARDDDGEDNQSDIADVADNATFGDRVRLVLDTSFTGKDALITRLQAGNLGNLNAATGTDESRLAYDSGADNDVILNRLQYRFPVGDKATAWIGTVGLDIDQIFDVTNPYLASDAVGVLSRFGRRNPAVHRGNEGAGLGVDVNFTDSVGLSFLYLANQTDAPSPLPKDGLFNGGYSAGAQLDFKPGDSLQASLTYLHSYSPGGAVDLFGSTGTDFAQDPFGGIATSADHLGAQVNFKLGSRASIGGWYGVVFSGAESLDQGTDDLSATAQNWAANLAFPDLGGKGNLLGLIVGQPPHTTDNDVTGREEQDSPWHFELLYRIAVNDKISITPGAYYIMNPEGDDRNDNILVGAIRTTFRF